jgi:putative flippase GtrA
MRIARSELIRFVIVGVVNSIFGYSVGVMLFLLLRENFPVFTISVIANSIAIVFSFVTQKVFVFRVKGHWTQQFIKGLAVYSVVTLVGSGVFWVLIEAVHLNVWISQAVVILCTAGIGLVGSKFFTFSAKPATEG